MEAAPRDPGALVDPDEAARGAGGTLRDLRAAHRDLGSAHDPAAPAHDPAAPADDPVASRDLDADAPRVATMSRSRGASRRRLGRSVRPAAESRLLEARRRDLYRRGAGSADVARYEALRAAARAGGRLGPVHSRRAAVLLTAVLAAMSVLGVSAAAVGGLLPTVEDAAPTRAPAALVPGAAAPVPVVRLPDAAGSQRFEGRGRGTAVLDRSSLGFDGGRLAVRLRVDATSDVRWTATRIDVRADWSSYPRVLADRSRILPGGTAWSVPLFYEGAPPMRIRVDVPADVGWRLAVDRG